jgi:hypothetical protein
MLDGNYFYNKTIRKCVAVFGTVFNNIKIVRSGSTEEKVPIAYGPRKKFLARIQSDSEAAGDNTIAIKLPRMSFEITSIDFDANSGLSKFNKRILGGVSGSASTVRVVKQSTPYTISMQLNIFATNQNDALQIFEQILPTFKPEYTISVKGLEGEGTITDVPIILTGTTISDDYEGDFETRRTILYTLDFAMKVRFIGGESEQNIIRTVDVFLYDNVTNPAIQKENAPYGIGNQNIRIAVDDDDLPPLDSTDTITTTFGFDHDSP